VSRVVRPEAFETWLKYPQDLKPSCGVRCSRCRTPQFDVEVYQCGSVILCRGCFREVVEELKRRAAELECRGEGG